MDGKGAQLKSTMTGGGGTGFPDDAAAELAAAMVRGKGKREEGRRG